MLKWGPTRVLTFGTIKMEAKNEFIDDHVLENGAANLILIQMHILKEFD